MTGKRKARDNAEPQDPLKALEAKWEAQGPAALATIREYDPAAFLTLLAAVAAEDDD